ncbi:amino acid-binding ACT domain protein [Aureococcus anophagefferens]|uniref:Amino acid-binding ACT domain protein n=1 Tax=Aureococcus anophagefferens TaxID=44056 RepID=A0ABR1GGE0_AURAN
MEAFMDLKAELKCVKASSSSADCSMESWWIARRGASGSRKPAPHRSPALALFALLLGTTAAFRATAPRRAATATVPSQRRAATPRRRAATPRRRAATVLRDTVGYAGEAGSPGELAARAYFGASSTPTPTRSLEDLFVDVETGAVDYGILAVENSLRGSINKAFDLLLQHDLRIYGEIVVTEGPLDYTRFLVLSTTDAAPPLARPKTSLAFAVIDRPGALAEALGEFGRRQGSKRERHAQLQRLISRPFSTRFG